MISVKRERKNILVAIVILLFAFIFFSIIKILVGQWTKSYDYAQAFITLSIIGYIV